MKEKKALSLAPEAWQMTFTESGNATMEEMVTLHHDIMAIMIFIFIFVLYMMVQTVVNFQTSKLGRGIKKKIPSTQIHNTPIEVI